MQCPEIPFGQETLEVRGLLELHCNDLNSRVASGKLKKKTLSGYRVAYNTLGNAKVGGSCVSALTPNDFTKVMHAIERHDFTLRTQKNLITAIKSIFKWGFDMGLAPQVRYEYLTPTTG